MTDWRDALVGIVWTKRRQPISSLPLSHSFSLNITHIRPTRTIPSQQEKYIFEEAEREKQHKGEREISHTVTFPLSILQKIFFGIDILSYPTHYVMNFPPYFYRSLDFHLYSSQLLTHASFFDSKLSNFLLKFSECPPATDGMERFACPTPDRQGRYRCIDDHVLCDGFIDCPEGADEDRQACMFYKTVSENLISAILIVFLCRRCKRRCL